MLGVQVWQDLLMQCVGGEGCHPSGMYAFSSTWVARLSWYLLEWGVGHGQVQAPQGMRKGHLIEVERNR